MFCRWDWTCLRRHSWLHYIQWLPLSLTIVHCVRLSPEWAVATTWVALSTLNHSLTVVTFILSSLTRTGWEPSLLHYVTFLNSHGMMSTSSQSICRKNFHEINEVFLMLSRTVLQMPPLFILQGPVKECWLGYSVSVTSECSKLLNSQTKERITKVLKRLGCFSLQPTIVPESWAARRSLSRSPKGCLSWPGAVLLPCTMLDEAVGITFFAESRHQYVRNIYTCDCLGFATNPQPAFSYISPEICTCEMGELLKQF